MDAKNLKSKMLNMVDQIRVIAKNPKSLVAKPSKYLSDVEGIGKPCHRFTVPGLEIMREDTHGSRSGSAILRKFGSRIYQAIKRVDIFEFLDDLEMKITA